VSISALEIRRARKALDAFCAQRNTLSSGSERLVCDQQQNALLVGQYVPPENEGNPQHFRALVRLSYEQGCWRVFLSNSGGGWQPYPPLPEADNVQAIIEELEQAPLHVHW
jgi:hypothetical protein